MELNHDIQLFLEQVSPKATGGKIDLEEFNRLKAIFYEYPCNLEIALWMLIAAGNAQERGRTDLGFDNWAVYVDEALNRDECWNDEELSQLHLTIATGYHIGNDDLLLQMKAREHIKKAYELSPQNWEVIDEYISIAHPPLDERPFLVEQMLRFGGDDNLMVVYKYTFHLSELLLYGHPEFRDKVVWGIKRLFELGLENTHMSPAYWRKRLEELEKQ